MAGSAQMWFLAYEPFPVISKIMILAATGADQIGKEAVRRVGDEAYSSAGGDGPSLKRSPVGVVQKFQLRIQIHSRSFIPADGLLAERRFQPESGDVA